MSDFFDHYKRPEWREMSARVMDAANYKCQDCGATDRRLNAHHTLYIRGRMPWDYPLSSLRCLCEDCHESRHELADKLKLVVGRLSQFGLARLFGQARSIEQEEERARELARARENGYVEEEEFTF